MKSFGADMLLSIRCNVLSNQNLSHGGMEDKEASNPYLKGMRLPQAVRLSFAAKQVDFSVVRY